MQTMEQALNRLQSSKFRAGFHLTKKEKAYFQEKGEAVIRQHAEDFIHNRLAPADPCNDGRQTPMHGHPVFKAQHATACCCRGCLEKWYRIPQHKELTESQQRKIVNLIMAWLEKEMDS